MLSSDDNLLLTAFEKPFDPDIDLATNSKSTKFVQDDVMMALVEGFAVIEVDRVNCLMVFEEMEDRLIVFNKVGERGSTRPESMLR